MRLDGAQLNIEKCVQKKSTETILGRAGKRARQESGAIYRFVKSVKPYYNRRDVNVLGKVSNYAGADILNLQFGAKRPERQ